MDKISYYISVMEQLSGCQWIELIKERIGCAVQCAWEKLHGPDWANLLAEYPQFADKCVWNKLQKNDCK